MSEDFFDGLDKAVTTLARDSSAEHAASLLQLSRELVASLDAREALLSVGEAVRELCQGERFLCLNDELQVTSARDHKGIDLPTPTPFCVELARVAVRDHKVSFVHLPMDSASWNATESVRALRLVGMIAVPLIGARGLRGVIYSDGKNSFVNRLDDATFEVLGLIGQHAAQAVDNAELMEQISKDPKSDLLNAAYFERRLHEEQKRSSRYQRPFSLMYLELADAAAWVKKYGTDGLDDIFRQLASSVHAECRSSDLLARLGPARFGILLPEMHVEGTHDIERFSLKEFVARLRLRIEGGSYRIGDVPQHVRFIVGAVTYQQAPVVGIKGILHEVELAIEVARREGDDRFLVR